LTWRSGAASAGVLNGYDSSLQHPFALFTFAKRQMQQRPA